jgi:hypothetical protein
VQRYDIVDIKTVRCVNFVANFNEWVYSLLECQRMNSRMIESDRAVLVDLHNIINNDDPNVESDTDELCAAMEVLPMICEICCEGVGTHTGGSIVEATDVVVSSSCPAGVLH